MKLGLDRVDIHPVVLSYRNKPKQAGGNKMIAACHTCKWESLTYAHKRWAEKSADKHQRIYHRGQSNIIAIKGAK